MKPPPFSYHDPETVSDVIGLLSSHENAKLLAGGQSLMPMLNMRYVLPDHVIDINRVAELSYIREDGDVLAIGALTRQREVEFSNLVAARCPLLREAVLNVGHRQTRNRGTVGGSLSHLDPSAEIPAVSAALDATIRISGPNGSRDVAMADFPLAYMTPSLEPDEVLTELRLPLWAKGHGHGFEEFARRHGDFAITAAAALLEVDGSSAITRASVTVSGVGPAPVRIEAVEKALIGTKGDEEAFRAVAEEFRTVDALDDIHASTEYRQHLATVLSRRALVKAYAQATGMAGGE